MINLARAITIAGVGLAVTLVAVPSASAVVREAGRTAAKAAAEAHGTPAQQSAGLRSATQDPDRRFTVGVYHVTPDGRIVGEQGPGGFAAHEVATASGAFGLQTQSEPVTTGGLPAQAHGVHPGGPVTLDMNGPEQATGAVC